MLLICQNGTLLWDNVYLASGFDISLKYAKHLVLDGSLIGLNIGLELTPQLAHFLLLNKVTLESRMSSYLSSVCTYRHHAFEEAEAKFAMLSYGFLTALYVLPTGPATVTRLLEQTL
jgi:hypothetical protein